MERNVELEQAIFNNPNDPSTYSVLADWLQSRGDPRGELIALAIAGKDDAVQALLEEHSEQFLGPLADHTETYDGSERPAFEWKHGFIRAARLSHDHNADELDVDGGLARVLEQLLDHPSGRFVQELAFGFNGDPNDDNLESLIATLARTPRPSIRTLVLGDFKYAGAARDEDRGDDTEISWYNVGDCSSLWRALPQLEKLIVQSTSTSYGQAGGVTLGELDLPALRHLEFRTGGLERSNFESIARGRFPQLVHLDVWFGQDNYGGDCTADDVAKLLARTDLPKLTHLGLMNCEFVDAAIPLLVRSPIAKQLVELDLSLGCLSDEGAQLLATHADAFPALQKLDVSQSYLTGDGIGALRKLAKTVVADDQRTGEDDDRYAAVGE
ncbi:MAG TPA: TIGR02996 domain-containing protein [Kofleriaceae bacterium]|nr:TIGR02996 domain-containing protein [Kofleriaceae bacterium]